MWRTLDTLFRDEWACEQGGNLSCLRNLHKSVNIFSHILQPPEEKLYKAWQNILQRIKTHTHIGHFVHGDSIPKLNIKKTLSGDRASERGEKCQSKMCHSKLINSPTETAVAVAAPHIHTFSWASVTCMQRRMNGWFGGKKSVSQKGEQQRLGTFHCCIIFAGFSRRCCELRTRLIPDTFFCLSLSLSLDSPRRDNNADLNCSFAYAFYTSWAPILPAHTWNKNKYVNCVWEWQKSQFTEDDRRCEILMN